MEQHDESRAREEVLNDFRLALERIDLAGEYNPFASDFEKALRIGLMWHLLCETDTTVTECVEEHHESDDEIAEEISGAKKYLQRYIDSGDVVFRDMAKDELRHASVLTKKANSRLPSGEEKAILKVHESEIAEVQKQIDSI